MAASAVLLLLLEQRVKNYFSKDRKYWQWLIRLEEFYLGPAKITDEFNKFSNQMPFYEFVIELALDVIRKHIEVTYERMTPERVPRCLSQDIDGTLHFHKMWDPTKRSILKFERMIDVFYDLGFIRERRLDRPQLTHEGRHWLYKFLS